MLKVIPISSYGDLVSDKVLSLQEADAVAGALNQTTDFDSYVVFIPRELAEEKPFDPEEGTDSVFVLELVEERETDAAYFARQGRSTAFIPKSATRVYVSRGDADIYAYSQETEGSA